MAALVELNSLLIFQWLTVIMGVIATLYPAAWAVYFFTRGNVQIAIVLAWMLFGEAISMAAAAYFSLMDAQSTYVLLDQAQIDGAVDRMILRWIIFVAGFLSTLRLTLYIAKKWRAVI